MLPTGGLREAPLLRQCSEASVHPFPRVRVMLHAYGRHSGLASSCGCTQQGGGSAAAGCVAAHAAQQEAGALAAASGLSISAAVARDSAGEALLWRNC